MAELMNSSLGLWLYLAVAGVLFVGWWSIHDVSEDAHISGGMYACLALVMSLIWFITLPLALIILIGMHGGAWLEESSGWLSRRWAGKDKKK